ncbi:MAG: hypothetical protein GTN74_12130 [Proteobacteria bacterium]|nr:hypothetical protein [Pseudomonadota bacterium]NIS71068.1 hypothetical protein [Pseudomonadota bacterium]
MKLFRPLALFSVFLMCLLPVTPFTPEISIIAQTLPSDVGLITSLSGEVAYWNESYQTMPAETQAFMKIRKGDRFTLPSGSSIQIVYFLGGRQETWMGPTTFIVGDSESQQEDGEKHATQPKIRILPAGATQGVRRIPGLLRRAGLTRPGAEQVRGETKVSSTAIDLSAQEKGEIAAARETYQSLRNQIPEQDITPELYLIGVLADYDRYDEMGAVIRQALKRQPDNETLKELEKWADTKASE